MFLHLRARFLGSVSLACGLAALWPLAGCRRDKPAPSIDSLAEVLKKSAEKTLAAPSLANEQIVVTSQARRSARRGRRRC